VTRWAILLCAAYLVGAIPFSWAVVRLATGQDVRRVGSGNVGATNAMRAAGKGMGALALLLDIAKGVGPVLAARSLGATAVVVSCVAALAVLGHMYSPFLGFSGGKGVATAAGALGAVEPIAAALSAVVFFAVVFWKRYVSLASLAAVGAFPLFVLLLVELRGGIYRDDVPFLAGSMLVPAIVAWKHRANIRRLRAGTERRLGDGPPAAEPGA
jgi:glycerol-3-phosphate acyltransferase PlsY